MLSVLLKENQGRCFGNEQLVIQDSQFIKQLEATLVKLKTPLSYRFCIDNGLYSMVQCKNPRVCE